MGTTLTFDAGAVGEFAGIHLPVPDGLKAFHWLGGDEAASILNYADPDKPARMLGSPTLEANYAECGYDTRANGFELDVTDNADLTMMAIIRGEASFPVAPYIMGVRELTAPYSLLFMNTQGRPRSAVYDASVATVTAAGTATSEIAGETDWHVVFFSCLDDGDGDGDGAVEMHFGDAAGPQTVTVAFTGPRRQALGKVIAGTAGVNTASLLAGEIKVAAVAVWHAYLDATARDAMIAWIRAEALAQRALTVA